MLDFAALPPEINSTKMYTGPGSGPMMAAATAWDALAVQLESVSRGYSSTILSLQGQNWSGPASEAMAAAATQHMTWATVTAAQAEQTAGQARAAAAAYETAFAATVPPAAVTANRAQLAVLVATNFFGQNAAAIAATEAAYAEMWAQDATAMYGYAGSAVPASTLTQFHQPSPTTNPAGQSAQGAAVAHAAETSTAGNSQSSLAGMMSTVSQLLHTLSTPGSSGSPTSLLTPAADLNVLTGDAASAPFTLVRTMGSGANMGFEFLFLATEAMPAVHAAAATTPAAAPSAVTVASPAPSPAGVQPTVLVSAGKAAPVGNLSVPAGWSSATPATSPATPLTQAQAPPAGHRAATTAAANQPKTPMGQAQPASLGPIEGLNGRRANGSGFRTQGWRFRMPRPAVGG